MTHSRLMLPRYLASPDSYNTIPAALGQVPILNANLFNNSRGLLLFSGRDASSAVPVPPVRLVIHFGNVFAGSRYNPAAIEHHARDWGIICVGIINGTCPEVPDLPVVSGFGYKGA